MKRYKVRFHLARGDNYMQWQVSDLQEGTKNYFDPDSKSIVMRDCTLGNYPSTAKKIFDGENKTVCAWVACDEISVVDLLPTTGSLTHYKYNPRKSPHWFTETTDNADNRQFKMMVTNNRKVYG